MTHITLNPTGHKPDSVWRLARDLGPIVYFIRTPEGPIKIGTTHGRLDNRVYARKATWTDILVITPGSYAEEAVWHERFAEHALGDELFAPAPEVMAAINELRASMRLKPVDQ